MERLADSFTIVMASPRGFADSDRLPSGATYLIDDVVGDLIAVVRHAGYERAAGDEADPGTSAVPGVRFDELLHVWPRAHPGKSQFVSSNLHFLTDAFDELVRTVGTVAGEL